MIHQEHIVVEHPLLTIGELMDLGTREPLERSSHLGNQSLRELVILTNLPVRPILVDTIAGNDAYAKPAYVVVGGSSHRLASGKQSDNIVVGGIRVAAERYDGLVSQHPALMELGSPATAGELHARSIAALNLAAHQPQTATAMLAGLGETGQALMAELAERGRLCRVVAAGGRISVLQTDHDGKAILDSVLGVADSTPPTEGTMLSLQGMMAMDILHALSNGRDRVTHLAGADMRRYTRDAELMQEVGGIVAGARQKLGEQAVKAHYVIVDVTGLAAAVHPEQAHIGSQYDLIVQHPSLADRRIQLVPGAHDIPAYSTMEAYA